MTTEIVHHEDVVPKELEAFNKRSATVVFSAFARWLSTERTAAELREAKEIVSAWNKVIEEFDKNLRKRLRDAITAFGERVSDKTLRLKTVAGDVDLRKNRAKEPTEVLLRALAERRGIDYEKDMATAVIYYEPDMRRIKVLIRAGTITEAEVEDCKPWLSESVVLS